MTAQTIDLASKKAIQQLNSEMMDLYFDQRWSAKRIATDPRFNRDITTIYAAAREEKKKGRFRVPASSVTRYDPRRVENRRTLSSAHAKLSVHVNRHMNAHGLNATQFGLLVNMTRNRVAEMMSGSYDLTIGELLKICRQIDYDPADIFHGMVNGTLTAVKSAA